MAIDKKKAPPIVKIGIILVCLLLVLSFIPWGGLGFFTGPAQNGAPGTGTLDAIAARHTPQITGLEGLLASQPTSYTVLMQLGHAYYDWAAEVMTATAAPRGSDRPLWLAAVSFYEQALALDATVPGDITDAAIARYYSGDIAGAIELIGTALEIDPNFAPAHFNAGIFHEAAGQVNEALAAYRRYLELDPQGTGPGSLTMAQNAVARLSAATPTPTPTPVPTPTVGATPAPTP